MIAARLVFGLILFAIPFRPSLFTTLFIHFNSSMFTRGYCYLKLQKDSIKFYVIQPVAVLARVHFSHRRIIKIPANDRILANSDKRSAPPSSIRQTSEKQLLDSAARETHRASRSAFPTYLLHPARDSDPACGPAYQPLARGVVVADRSRFDSNSIRTSRRKARRALVSVIGNKFRVKLPVTPGLDPASRTLRGGEERRLGREGGRGRATWPCKSKQQ